MKRTKKTVEINLRTPELYLICFKLSAAESTSRSRDSKCIDEILSRFTSTYNLLPSVWMVYTEMHVDEIFDSIDLSEHFNQRLGDQLLVSKVDLSEGNFLVADDTEINEMMIKILQQFGK